MRKVFIIVALLFAGVSFNGCELDENDCAMCREVTRDADGTIVEEKEPREFCGTELEEIEAESPVTIGGLTTQWECE